ncbi:hypothetical protein CAF53_22350 [Sphingobium sp. LB126]|nr:hypothetical protein CAF53_22350 [Sphingobium sp. LB126]
MTIMKQIGCAFLLTLAFSANAAEAAPARHVVRDTSRSELEDMKITLQRSACLGICPDYKVTIHGDGRIVFTTETSPTDRVAGLHRKFAPVRGVFLPGTHEDRVDPRAVAVLFDRFQAANFFGLRNQYRASVTDHPTYTLTLDMGKRHKTVEDYVGREVGMPAAVTDLEKAVDELAGTARWVRGTQALIPLLENEHFDFASADAAELLVEGVQGNADEDLLVALFDRGAPLSVPVGRDGSTSQPGGDEAPAGIRLLEGSIKAGRPKLFSRLASTGWLDRLGKDAAAQLFAQNAGGCSADLVDAVASAGVDIDAPETINPNADAREAQGGTALMKLGTSYGCKDETRRLAAAERLIAKGANPNRIDSLGRNSLYGVENVALLDLLLQHGADATIKDREGLSMIFGSWTDDIVIRLIEAGASPVGNYGFDSNRTLLEETKARRMPKVAAWLASHITTAER